MVIYEALRRKYEREQRAQQIGHSLSPTPTPLSTQNRFCSNCLRTQRFLDHGTSLDCPNCDKRLYPVTVAGPSPSSSSSPSSLRETGVLQRGVA